jgi:hypothetical protein
MNGTYSIKVKSLKENAIRSAQYANYYILECDVCGETCPKRIDYAPKTKRTYCKQECFSIMQQEMNKRKAHKDGWRVSKAHRGYVIKRIWDDRYKGEWVYQHRYNMEQYLDRKLLKTEQIHHIDMDKTNNNIDNLWLCSASEHQSAHMSFNSLCALGMKKAIQFKFNRETGKYYLYDK